jgi:outer membrane protein TolC
MNLRIAGVFRIVAVVALSLILADNAFSLTLEEGLRIIEDRSRELKISMKGEEIADEGIRLARSGLLPWIDLYANQTWLKYQPEARFGAFGSVPISEDEFLTYGFRLNQKIYDFGKTYAGIRGARHMLEARRIETNSVRNQVALQFILAYLDLLEAEKMLAVAEEEVRMFDAHLRDTDAMYKEGLITKNDLLQAEVMSSDANQRLLKARNMKDVAMSRLNTLLLRPIDEDIELEEVEDVLIVGISLDKAMQNLRERRHELKALKSQIQAKEEELRSVRAEYLPEIYLSGGYEYQENEYMVHEDNWSAVVGINLNLFAGGSKGARLGSVRKEIEALRLQYDNLLDSIMLEVKAGYLGMVSSRQRVDVTEKAIEQAKENLRLAKLRYKEGIGTSTDVTDAITLLRGAETNYYRALYDLKRAEARFLYAAGYDLINEYGGKDGR